MIIRTKEEFLTIFEDCFSFLEKQSFPIGEINGNIHFVKGSRYFGICRRNKDNTFTIGFNENFALKGSLGGLKSTILHELIHTFPLCYNHGKEFQYYAKKISALSGVEIKTKGGNKTFEDNKLLR